MPCKAAGVGYGTKPNLPSDNNDLKKHAADPESQKFSNKNPKLNPDWWNKNAFQL
ncbi:hypothetical protein SAMN02799642_05293 [Methylobacterium brachiatum]|nr:hypothetical protein SAMN02799642_05293 [Methylobacterium brachiatum]